MSSSEGKHSLLTILVENVALFMGSYFKLLPWLWVLTLNSQRHIYTRPPVGVCGLFYGLFIDGGMYLYLPPSILDYFQSASLHSTFSVIFKLYMEASITNVASKLVRMDSLS